MYTHTTQRHFRINNLQYQLSFKLSMKDLKKTETLGQLVTQVLLQKSSTPEISLNLLLPLYHVPSFVSFAIRMSDSRETTTTLKSFEQESGTSSPKVRRRKKRIS